jgi:hypothetical protein
MLITRTSAVSKIERTIDIPCTEEQYFAWESGMSIQKAMPNISASDREFILNGITPDEWDSMCPPEEDDDGISGFDDPIYQIDDPL